MKINPHTLLAPWFAAAIIMASASVGASTVITHTFAPGNLEGWQQIVISGGDPTLDEVRLFATGSTFGNRMLWQDPTGDVGGLTVTTTGNADYRGTAHNSAILRSPTFTLDGENGSATLTTLTVTEIRFDLLGGRSPIGPANVSDIPAASINRPSGNLGGYLGVALRRVSDDDYLIWTTRSGNGQSNAGSPLGWEPFTLNATVLAAAVAGEAPGTLYTIDLIDAAHGDWGFVSMDNISFTAVPEPSAALAGIVLVLGLLRRRRA